MCRRCRPSLPAPRDRHRTPATPGGNRVAPRHPASVGIRPGREHHHVAGARGSGVVAGRASTGTRGRGEDRPCGSERAAGPSKPHRRCGSLTGCVAAREVLLRRDSDSADAGYRLDEGGDDAAFRIVENRSGDVDLAVGHGYGPARRSRIGVEAVPDLARDAFVVDRERREKVASRDDSDEISAVDDR